MTIRKFHVARFLELAQHGACCCARNIGEIGQILLADVDLDRNGSRRVEKAAVAQAQQDRDQAPVVITEHKVRRSANGCFEMSKGDQADEPPSPGIFLSDRLNRVQRKMQELRALRCNETGSTPLA